MDNDINIHDTPRHFLLVTKQGELISKEDPNDLAEIIGEMPSWILRWGVLVLMFIVISVFVGAWIFKYPDTVEVNCTIEPFKSVTMAKVNIDYNNFRKIKNNDKVLIKLSAFPNDQYGALEGKIVHLPKISGNSSLLVEVELKNSLTTNLHKKIPPLNILYGKAEIFMEEKNMLKRLFEKI